MTVETFFVLAKVLTKKPGFFILIRSPKNRFSEYGPLLKGLAMLRDLVFCQRIGQNGKESRTLELWANAPEGQTAVKPARVRQ